MTSSTSTSRFKRSYIASSSVVAVFLVLGAISNLGGERRMIGYSVAAVLVSGAPFLPLFLRGGFNSNFRVAVCITCILSLVFGAILLGAFGEFIRTGGAEGPKGEGSPLAMIFGMTFFALMFFCPWLLAALRGLRAWRSKKTSVGADGTDGGKLLL